MDLLGWESLPTELLQEIFSLLPIKNLGRCSQVCSSWYYTFHTDYPWKTFIFKDGVFVRRKFTQHSGWQYHIDHWKLRYLITNAARRWRTLVIKPVKNLFNLYEFFRVLTNFSEYYEKHSDTDKPLGTVRNFHFEWKLHVDEDEASGIMHEKDIGTGGEMLHTLTNVLRHMSGLKSISLIDLQLTHWEADQFINEVLELFSAQLRSLCLLNITLYPRAFMQVGLFLNLCKLQISPQMIDESILSLLSCLQNLQTIYIIQDEKSADAPSCNRNAWKQYCVQNKGRTRIWLILRGKPKLDLIIQPYAPIYGIKMEMSSGKLTSDLAEKISFYYSDSLKEFIQCGLERMKRGKKMIERVDFPIIEIARRCNKLEILACRERMSHGTSIMLSVLANRNVFKLYIRENALLKRVCWCRTDVKQYDIDFDWLKEACKTREIVTETVKTLTNQNWPVLKDKYYMKFCT